MTTALPTAVVTATVTMTDLAATQTPATAACPGGSTLVGGGIALQPGVAGATYTNGLKINGSEPGDGTAANGTTDPSVWTALGGFGGQADPNDTVTASAVCLSGGVGATVVQSASDVGSSALSATGFGPVTATCPAGTTLLSGGAAAVPVADGSLKPIASFPSDSGGNPAAAGSANPRSWTAFSRNSSAGGPANSNTPTTTVFALCAQATLSTVVAETSTFLPTATGSAVQTATTTCPAGDGLMSGGVAIDDGNAPPGPSQFGVHLITDDATDAGGALVTSGPASSWTATAHTGGIPATVGVHAFALCASPVGTVTTTTAAAGATTSTTSTTSPTGTTGTTSPSTTSTRAGTTTTQGSTTTTTDPGSAASTTTGETSVGTATTTGSLLVVTGTGTGRSLAVALGLVGIGLLVVVSGRRARQRRP